MKNACALVALFGFVALALCLSALDFGFVLTEGRKTVLVIIGCVTACAALGLLDAVTTERNAR